MFKKKHTDSRGTSHAKKTCTALLLLSALTGCGGGGTNTENTDNTTGTTDNETVTSPTTNVTPPTTGTTGDFRVLAFNDLGMHCMDREYSIYSIPPPHNVLNAQVIKRGA